MNGHRTTLDRINGIVYYTNGGSESGKSTPRIARGHKRRARYAQLGRCLKARAYKPIDQVGQFIDGHESRDRLAVFGDRDLFAVLNTLQQLTQSSLRILHIHLFRHAGQV